MASWGYEHFHCRIIGTNVATETYTVYKIRDNLMFPDPEAVGPRYHTKLFVLTAPSTGDGFIHHVTGNLVLGLK